MNFAIIKREGVSVVVWDHTDTSRPATEVEIELWEENRGLKQVVAALRAQLELDTWDLRCRKAKVT